MHSGWKTKGFILSICNFYLCAYFNLFYFIINFKTIILLMSGRVVLVFTIYLSIYLCSYGWITVGTASLNTTKSSFKNILLMKSLSPSIPLPNYEHWLHLVALCSNTIWQKLREIVWSIGHVSFIKSLFRKRNKHLTNQSLGVKVSIITTTITMWSLFKNEFKQMFWRRQLVYVSGTAAYSKQGFLPLWQFLYCVWFLENCEVNF